MPRRIERAPQILDDAGIVVICLDKLLSIKTPWEDSVITDRIVSALWRKRYPVTLPCLGVNDPLYLARALDQRHPDRKGEVDAVIKELELSWAMEDREPTPGLRELCEHLSRSDVPTALVSSLTNDLLESVIASTLELRDDLPTYGRGLEPSLGEARGAAALRASSDVARPGRVVVIAHHQLAHDMSAMLDDAEVLPVEEKSVGACSTRADEAQTVRRKGIIDLALECELTAAERKDLSLRKRNRDRIHELLSKGSMTDDEIFEYGQLTQPLKILGNVYKSGWANDESSRLNLNFIRDRRPKAAEQLFLLEVVSTDVTLAESALRNWLVVHHGKDFSKPARTTFGGLVNQAEDAGMKASLIARLRAFNQFRNEAVHALSKGGRTYFEMSTDFLEFASLVRDLERYVITAAPAWRERREFPQS